MEFEYNSPVAMSISAVVTRCGCGLTEYEPGHVCPTPLEVVDLGVIAEMEESDALD